MSNGHEFYDDFDFFDDNDDSGASDTSNKDAAGGSLEDLYSAITLRPADIEFALVDALDEEDSPSSQWADKEYAETAFRGLSDPRKGQRRVNLPLPRVTEEDFPPGPQRKAFIFIRHFAHNLCAKKTEVADRAIAARWLFSVIDSNEVTFELCCRAVSARPDVVRLRLQYELWKRWIIFDKPIPRLVVPVPDILFDDIQQVSGIEGHHIAQIAWEWPGIKTNTLLLAAADCETLDQVPEAYYTAFASLDRLHILSPKDEGWWLTGRNPMLAHQDRQSQHSQPIHRGETASFSGLFD